MGAPDLPREQTPPSILTPSRAVNLGASDELGAETHPFHRWLLTLVGDAAYSRSSR